MSGARARGMKVGLLVDAATFLLVASVSLLLPCYVCGGRMRKSVGRARDGAVYLARDETLRRVLGVGFVSLLFMTAVAPADSRPRLRRVQRTACLRGDLLDHGR